MMKADIWKKKIFDVINILIRVIKYGCDGGTHTPIGPLAPPEDLFPNQENP